MNRVAMKAVLAGGFFVILSVALALPQEGNNAKKEVRSPAVDDDFPTFPDEKPSTFSIGSFISGRMGNLFNNFLQLPSVVFRFVSGVIARQPFAKLREEVRNLNISYPK